MDIYGVIGWPIRHSLSPLMHNAAFKKLDIDAEYRKFEIRPEGLEDFLINDISVKDTEGNSVRAKDIKGFNITIPHKIRAKEIIDRNNPLDVAEADKYYIEVSGAINTVKKEGRRLRYMNTDPIGFSHSLNKDLGLKSLKDKSVLLIGCGGAGRAIIAALTPSGHYIREIYVYEVDKDTVNSAGKYFAGFRGKIKFISEKDISEVIKKCHLLVNASPVGMEEGDERSIVDKSVLALNRELYVYDVVYNRETALLKSAKSLGMKAADGRGMLASQGAFSFSFWRQDITPAEVLPIMRKALDTALDK